MIPVILTLLLTSPYVCNQFCRDTSRPPEKGVKYVCCGGCRQWLMAPRDAVYVVCAQCDSINNCNLAPKVGTASCVASTVGVASIASVHCVGWLRHLVRARCWAVVLLLGYMMRGRYDHTEFPERPHVDRHCSLCTAFHLYEHD